MSFKCLCPEDELGSGGKILRSRRFAVSASSPFVRPKSPPSSESPGFLTALFTGAGKLLSSVFVFSSSPSPSPSSLSSSASDICPASDDNGCENDDDAYNGDDDQTVRRKKVDATQQELHDSTGRNSIASPGDWCSLSQTRRSPGAFPCSAHSLRVLTPDTLLSQAHFPVLSHVSIEAKKRFEEKLESRSNLDWDHGPCTLNTAMLPNVTEDEVCSPIDMDKFYTEARRPWASPSSSSIGFKTPLRMHLTMMKHHVQMHAVISLHPRV